MRGTNIYDKDSTANQLLILEYFKEYIEHSRQ